MIGLLALQRPSEKPKKIIILIVILNGNLLSSSFFFSFISIRAIKLKKDLSTLDLLGTLYLRRSKLDLARLVYQGLWARYSAVAENVQSTSGSKLSNLSTEPETKAKLLNEYRTELRQPSSANIHYVSCTKFFFCYFLNLFDI